MKVFCYGDSNTYGYNPVDCKRHPKDVRWTGMLQKLLGEDYEVIEQGCNGRTTVFPEPGAEWKSGLYGLKVCLNTYKPVELMIIMLGTNDLKEYYHASAEMIADGAETLVKEAKAFLMDKQGFEPKIILVSPIEIGADMEHSYFSNHFKADSIERSKQFPALYEAVAKRQGCYFVNAASVAEPSKEDCLHMMPDSHKALAELLYEAVKDLTLGLA